MIKYGFTLKKLVVRGEDKKDAVLAFDKGLNIVAGASDTGKSFAFECINYILGSKDVPERPIEANGYDRVLLEIEDNSNKQISTFQRSMNESEMSKIYHVYSDIANMENCDIETLSSKHDAKESLSKLLLSICNCKYENVLAAVSNGRTRAFSFRDLVHINMLSETRVVGKNSPVYTSDNKKDTSRTSEATSFHTLILGKDYKKAKKSEDPEVAKARLKGQVEELTILCDTLRQEISECMKHTEGKKYEDVKSEIGRLKTLVEEKKKLIAIEEDRYKIFKEEYYELVRKQERTEANAKKFCLLKKNYESDIERLNFIEEAHCYTEQLVDVKCPVCNSSFNNYPDKETTDNSLYYIALEKEKQKLSMQLSDLQETIDDFNKDILILNKEFENKNQEMLVLEQNIINELKPIVTKALDELDILFNIRDFFMKISNNEQRIESLNDRINILNEKISTKRVNGNVGEIIYSPEELIKDLCDNMKELLLEWDFENSDVYFNFEKNDVIVGNKEKISFGKGARAIINTAFVIGTMQYCLSRNLPHPTFVVIDSPLTTYKEKDKKKGELNEEVLDSVKQAFFKNLSEMSKDYQIIIFDNVAPPANLKDIKYHHFSGNKDIDRMGFIPQN